MRHLRIDQARRIALAAQGFADPAPKSVVDRRHLRRVIARIGLLQLDSVNVCVRSHYMPLFSRLGPYRRPLIDEFAYDDGALFEYWGHEASLLPVETFPLYRHRMETPPRWRVAQELARDHPSYIEAVYRQVEQRGPISVGDLEGGGDRTGPWWGYGKGKIALEWLFHLGRIGCSTRVNFTRYYDLIERIIPAEQLSGPVLSAPEANRQLLLMAAKSHGVGTALDLADYYRIRVPEARPLLAELVEEGRLEQVAVEGWAKPAYLHPEARMPRRIETEAFLSPFDPVVWERSRTERLFDFHYRIEIYVPEPKRRFGYYVYPFLLNDQIVGRVDLKADRAKGRLLAKAVHLEAGHDRDEVAAAMARRLEEMATWLELDGVEVGQLGDLAPTLRNSIG